jgi:membrane protease YdiL (CAAX protease family)
MALGAAAWLLGLALLRSWGSVLPLFGLALTLAVVIAATDATTRRLLAPRAAPLAIGAAAAGVMIAATYLLYPLCVRLWPPLGDEVRDLYGLLFGRLGHGLGRWAVGPVVAITAFCEEIIFRGRLLAGHKASAARIVGSAAFYALVHITSGRPLLVALAFVCGLAWGFLRSLTDSLWTAGVCHVGWDLAIMVVAPLA